MEKLVTWLPQTPRTARAIPVLGRRDSACQPERCQNARSEWAAGELTQVAGDFRKGTSGTALPPHRSRDALAAPAAPAANVLAVLQSLHDGGASIRISASLSASQGTVPLGEVCVLMFPYLWSSSNDLIPK